MTLRLSHFFPIVFLVACSQANSNRHSSSEDPVQITATKQDIRARAALMKVLARLADQETPQEAPWISQYKETLRSKTLSCDIKNEKLSDVLLFFADATGLNLVIHDRVDADALRITFKQEQQPVKKALDSILEQCQLKRHFYKESILIVPKQGDESVLEFYEVSDIVEKVPDYPAPELGLVNPNIIGIGRGAAQPGPRHHLAIYDVQDLVSPVPDFPGPRIQVSELEKEKPHKSRLSRSWKPSSLPQHSLRIKVGEKDELPLDDLDITVQIDGFQARVLIDASFTNSHPKRLEGQFQLRLPSGASPYYLAFGEQRVSLNQAKTPSLPVASTVANTLSVRSKEWSGVREAIMVPSTQAASAYKSEVRKAVDPALLEWSGAGVFQCQLYPLQGLKQHRVVLAYDVPLLRQGQDWVYKLNLPKAQRRPRVHIFSRSQAKPTLAQRGDFQGSTGSWRFEQRDAPNLEYQVRIPGDEAVILLDNDHQLGDHFALRYQPQLPPMTDSKQYSRAVFLLDCSSSAKTGFAQRVQLMEAILRLNRATIKEFAVLFFNIEQYWLRKSFLKNNSESVQQLMKTLNRTVLEGATDLHSALKEAHNAPWLKAQGSHHCYFLLSDGSANWGEQRPSDLLSTVEKQPIYCYQFGFAGTHKDILEALAAQSGGSLFSAYNNQEIESAATAHTKRPWLVQSVALPGSQDILFGGRSKTVYPGQSLLITGKGRVDGPVTLELKSGEKVKRIQWQPRVLKSQLATRIYGQCAHQKMAKLSTELALSMDMAYRIPGPNCSLLMLESERDYKNHFQFDLKKHIKSAKEARIQKLTETFRNSKNLVSGPRQQFQDLIQLLKKHPKVSLQFSQDSLTFLNQLNDSDFERLAPKPQCAQRTKDQASRNIDESADWNAMAQSLHKKGLRSEALRALSASLEFQAGNMDQLRNVAYSSLSWGYHEEAAMLLKTLILRRPAESLPYLTMARALSKAKRIKAAIAWFELALALQNLPENTRLTTGQFYLRLLSKIETESSDEALKAFASKRFKSLRPMFPVIRKGAVVIHLSWNTDRSDVDLFVTEKGGKQCSFNRRVLDSGARLNQDVTRGYGPEHFVHPNPNLYPLQIDLSYFRSNQDRTSQVTRAYLTLIKNWGRDSESVESFIVPLSSAKEKVMVTRLGSFED